MIRLIIIPLLFLATTSFAQTEITWETLTDVRFSDKFNKRVQAYVYFPHFGPSVKALSGKEVYLEGYMMPMGPEEGFYILSRYPYASCFFCGQSGPDSIVQLKMKPNPPEFRMDQIVTIKGKLKLNQNNIDECPYLMVEAEVYDPNKQQ